MLVLFISLLCWTQTEGGGCCAPLANIKPNDVELSVGQSFNLTCEFRCLGAHHAQLWKDNSAQNVLLLNVSSAYPNVSLVLQVLFATEVDAGSYTCKTHPPDTISPALEISIADNLKTTMSSQPSNSSQLPSANKSSCPNGATLQKGLIGQIWYWMLLGKTAFLLLLSLFSLAVKCKSG